MAAEELTPHVKYSLAKYVDKGEDAWVQQPGLECTLPGNAGPLKLAVFGVFDGHGGKQAAVYASRHLHSNLQAALAEYTASSSEPDSSDAAAANDGQQAAAEETEAPRTSLAGLNGPTALAACDDADRVAAALPRALAAAFAATEQAFVAHSQESGSTATVAAISGWSVIVANVGDSLAYLDTGSEVVQVSGNHRLDDSKAERERVAGAGAEVAQSEVDGKPVGPQRVWPGGLAMGRTIGDASAGAVVTCEPEVRQVTLPRGGGRLLLASDGLWDSVSPKTALHHIRGLPASKAAAELVNMCQRGKKPRDDITALVVDAIPPDTPDAKLPLLLVARSNGGHGGNGIAAGVQDAEPVNIFWPLTGNGSSHWRCDVWQRRLAMAQARQQAAEAAAAAEAEAAAQAAEAAAKDEACVRQAVADAARDLSDGEDAASASGSDAGGSDAASEDGGVQYASEIHRQMAALQGEPSELEAAAELQLQEKQQRLERQKLKEQQAAEAAEAAAGWEEVPASNRQQLGRGRGGRGGRGRDGGRGGQQHGRGRQRGRGQQDSDQLQPDQQAAGDAQETSSPQAAAAAGDPGVAGDSTEQPAEAGVSGSADAADSLAAAEAAGVTQEPGGAGRGRGRGRQQGRGGGRGRRYGDRREGGEAAQGRGGRHMAHHLVGQGGQGRGHGRRGDGADLQQGRGRWLGRRGSEAHHQQRQGPPYASLPGAGSVSQPQPQQEEKPPQRQQQQSRQPQRQHQPQQAHPKPPRKPVPSGSVSAQQLFDAMRDAGDSDAAGGSSAAGNGPPAAAAGNTANGSAEHVNGFSPHMYRHEHAPQHRQRSGVGQLQFGSYSADSAPPSQPPQPPQQQRQQQLQFGTMNYADPATPQQQQRPRQMRPVSNGPAPPQQHQYQHQEQQLASQEAARLAAERAMRPSSHYMGAEFRQQQLPPQRRAYDSIAAQRAVGGGRPARGRGGRCGVRQGGRGGRGGSAGRGRSGFVGVNVGHDAAVPHVLQAQPDGHKRV